MNRKFMGVIGYILLFQFLFNEATGVWGYVHKKVVIIPSIDEERAIVMIAVIYILFMMCGAVTMHSAWTSYEKGTMSRSVMRAYTITMLTLMCVITWAIIIRFIIILWGMY